LPKLSIVFHRYITSLFNFKRWIHGQFLTNCLTVSFGPSDTTWILFLLECSVTFRTTKFKYLKVNHNSMNINMFHWMGVIIIRFLFTHLTVVSHEMHSMSRVYFRRTEITVINTHFGDLINEKSYLKISL